MGEKLASWALRVVFNVPYLEACYKDSSAGACPVRGANRGHPVKVMGDAHLGLQSVCLTAGLPFRLAWQEPHEIQLGQMQGPAPEEDRAHTLTKAGSCLAGPAYSAQKAWGTAGLA